MERSGISVEKTLQAVLKVRPDHPEALKRLWKLELQQGNTEKAEDYRKQLLTLSPLDRDLRDL